MENQRKHIGFRSRLELGFKAQFLAGSMRQQRRARFDSLVGERSASWVKQAFGLWPDLQREFRLQDMGGGCYALGNAEGVVNNKAPGIRLCGLILRRCIGL